MTMRVLNKVKKLGKKKILGIILVALILCTAGILLVRSNSTTESAVSENQTVAVQRGDLTIDITAVGNLALSVKEDLAFEIPGRVEEITVEEILVEEGDSVEKGQLLAKLDTLEWNDMLRVLERDLLQAEISLENAKRALDDAEEGTLTQIDTDDGIRVVEIVDDWEVEIKEMQLKLAEARFEDDLKALREALEESPGIIAPFDGFITKVNIEGGDEILTGKVAVELADPNKFEADILVSEMDIMQVKLGGKAWVQVDAIQGMSLPAKVTRISPTATIQSGVVNYEVKVELEPLEAVIQEQQQARQAAVEKITQGELPERLQQAVDEGRLKTTCPDLTPSVWSRQQNQCHDKCASHFFPSG